MAKESMKAREVICRAPSPPEKRKSGTSAQPLQSDRSSERIHARIRSQPYSVPRDGFQRPHPGSKESELVREKFEGLEV